MKIYYTHINEIVKIIQAWLPLISIDESSDIKEDIYNTVYNNIKLVKDK